jgi:prophage regulatory protein
MCVLQVLACSCPSPQSTQLLRIPSDPASEFGRAALAPAPLVAGGYSVPHGSQRLRTLPAPRRVKRRSRGALSGVKTPRTLLSLTRGVLRSTSLKGKQLRRGGVLRSLAPGLHLRPPGKDAAVEGRWAVQFIRPRQVLEMIGVSRTTLWRMVQAGTFPRPVRITERNCGFVLDTVEAWMKARAAGIPWGTDGALGDPAREKRTTLGLARRAAAQG